MPFFTWKGLDPKYVDGFVQSMLESIVYPEQRGKPFEYRPDRRDTYMDAMDKEKKRGEYKKMREAELRKDLAQSDHLGVFGPDGDAQMVCEKGKVAEFTGEGLQPKVIKERLLKLRELAGRVIRDVETGEVKGLRPIGEVKREYGWLEVEKPVPAPKPVEEAAEDAEPTRDEYVGFHAANSSKEEILKKAEELGLKPDARKSVATLLGEIYDAKMGE